VTWKQILFSFRGRLNRKPYWIATISLYLLYGVFSLGFLYVILSGEQLGSENGNSLTAGKTVAMGLLVPVVLMLGYCQLAIGAKRLHDRNKSAWWLLVIIVGSGLFEFATIYNVPGIGTEEDPTALGQGLMVFSVLVCLWFFVELGFFKGSQGPNRFGPDPLGAEAADAGL
jgi:uncharacterized membrane protein YhaH (DUF805 family)